MCYKFCWNVALLLSTETIKYSAMYLLPTWLSEYIRKPFIKRELSTYIHCVVQRLHNFDIRRYGPGETCELLPTRLTFQEKLPVPNFATFLVYFSNNFIIIPYFIDGNLNTRKQSIYLSHIQNVSTPINSQLQIQLTHN